VLEEECHMYQLNGNYTTGEFTPTGEFSPRPTGQFTPTGDFSPKPTGEYGNYTTENFILFKPLTFRPLTFRPFGSKL